MQTLKPFPIVGRWIEGRPTMNRNQIIVAAIAPIAAHTAFVFVRSGNFLPGFAAEYSVRWIIFAGLMALVARPENLIARGALLGAFLGANTAMTLATFGQPLATLPIAVAIHTVLGALGGLAVHLMQPKVVAAPPDA